MSAIPSGGFLVVKQPQDVEETTFGVTPTASPTFNWIGAVESFDPQADMSAQEVRQVGSEDAYKVLLGKEVYNAKIEYLLQASRFAKYVVNAQGGGSGTIDKSLSILTSVKLNGTENFVFLKGSRVKSLKLAGKPGEPIKASAELVCKEITTPSALHGLTTPTFASDPATAPWNFQDGGTSPITFGGTALDVTEINITFERNLEPIYVLGDTKLKYLPPKHRGVKGDMTILWTGTSNYADLLALTERTLVWTLKTGVSTLTLNNVSLNKLDSLTMKPEDVLFEKFSFTARAASLS